MVFFKSCGNTHSSKAADLASIGDDYAKQPRGKVNVPTLHLYFLNLHFILSNNLLHMMN